MQYFTELEDKLHFMVLEVVRQLEDTLKIIKSSGNRPEQQAAQPQKHPRADLVDKVKARDDHIDNYKSVIENICFSRIHGHETLHKQRVDFIRAVNIISNNLERISDFAVNIVGQIGYIETPVIMNDYKYRPYFEHMISSLELVNKALFQRDLHLALKICKAEFIIDKLYKNSFDTIIEELNFDKNKHDLVTILFIFRYLERMGDSLLNIGEAVIFSVFGEKLKIHQYQALKENLDSINTDIPIDEVDFESIWESRSGCRIGKIMDPTIRGGKGVLFKEGRKAKIAREKQNIEVWREIFPSLVPKVFSYNQHKDSGSMLLEFLPGCSFQETFSLFDQEIQENAFFLLKETLHLIWEKTMKPEPVNSGFIAQIMSRLDDVLMIHPEFDFSQPRIGSLNSPSLGSLMNSLKDIETRLNAPFSIFIHGDFNSNNIIYNQKDQQIYFIDLHRSCYGDYVQDASVFLVSNFRQPNFDPEFRASMNQLNQDFFDFVQDFALEHHDSLFKIRTALGLMRSFFTSTRFELNRDFAGSMYQRAVYLAEKIMDHKGQPWEDFDLPSDVFKYSSF